MRRADSPHGPVSPLRRSIFFLYNAGVAAASNSYPAIVSFARDRRRPMREGLLLEHDLVRKPVPTFRDHALVSKAASLLAGAGAQAWTAARDSWHALRPQRARSYRPEAHYMRGPGPKWRAKHAGLSAGS
jgi:hypothetical protein